MNIPDEFTFILLNEEATEIMRGMTAKFREQRPGVMPPDEFVFRDVAGGTEVLHGPKAVEFLDRVMRPGESYSDVIIRLHTAHQRVKKETLQ
jgi:hypothetical protein